MRCSPLNRALHGNEMKAIKLIGVILLCSSLSSYITWLFVKDSYEAGYDLVGLTCQSSTVLLNTKVLTLDDNDELRCHLAKHTQWFSEDLAAADIPDEYIIGGPNLPHMTKSFIRESLEEYRSSKLKQYASECKTKEKLF